METDCIIALIAGIMVLVSGSVIGFYSWDKAYGGRNVITGIGVMVLGAVLIAGSFSANNSAKERKARESEVVEKYKEGTDLYINGVKKDNIDLNGVNLDNYDITVEKDKIYLKENRKEKPGKFRGEETMLMYITTSEMLEEERMQEILRADTKKERRLCLFCKKDDTFSFEDVAGLLPAAKKMEILPKCCASSEDMLLQIGMMAAQKKNSDSVFTVLPTEEFDETLSLYGIERYDGKTQKTSTGSVKRQSRKRKENEKPRAVQTISDCDPMMDTSMNPPVSLHVKTDEKIDPADDLAGEDIPRPSIPDNSTDRKIFLSILEMKASDAGFDGTDEKFALAIADCMEQFEINKRPLKPAIFQKFGEENGEKVYNQLKEKYVYLVNSLTCKKQEK